MAIGVYRCSGVRIFEGIGLTENLQTTNFAFAYLQLYSRFSPFGGLADGSKLAEQLGQFGQDDTQLAAALTDTFSLTGSSQWRVLLDEAGVTPLFGAEVGLSWGSGHARTLPASVLLLAESSVGYSNLCRLIGAGLTTAGTSSLTAYLDLETLSRYRSGLIAIAPYYGGPITAALRLNKGAEAKNRAQALRDIFGKDNFFLGAPPPAGQPIADEAYDPRLAGVIKLNAALVKLARDLKLELIGTGEARYVAVEEAGSYAALRSRLNRVLADQYSASAVMLQQPQDWLYYNRPDRPTAELHLHSPKELLAHYNEKDWPGALANNRAIAARCAGCRFEESDPLAILRQCCEIELERRYASPEGELPEEQQTRAWLESELADIEELGLAGSLLAAAKAVAAVSEFRQIIVARRLSGSLVAYLVGLSERPPELIEGDSFHFAFEEGSRPLRLEVGRQGRERLIVALNENGLEEQSWKVAPVVSSSPETGGPAMLHPRQIIMSILDQPPGDLLPLQPALETKNGTELRLGVQPGPVLPPGLYRLEIIEASGVSRLQMALDILNEGRLREGYEPLEPSELPQPVEGDYVEPGLYERALLNTRLEWFKQNYPAAYYAAALSLADLEKRGGLAELARQAGLKVLPPRLGSSKAHFSIEDESSIRSGLVAVLSWEKAERLGISRAFATPDEVARAVVLSKEEWGRLAWSGALDNFGSREALAEAVEALTRASEEWSEWHTLQVQQEEAADKPAQTEMSGQLNMFGLFEAAPPEIVETPAEPKPVQLPQATALSRLQRLKQQFATLGFYTVEHPLWSQLPADRADNSRSDILTLGEVTAKAGATPETQPLLMAGMIIGLRRLPFTEAGRGQELAVVRLEDWTGQVELIIPPSLPVTFDLEEGAALTALARWLKAEPHAVLIAEKLDVYPPSRQMKLEEEVADLAVALDNADEVPPDSNSSLAGPPPGDDGWASSLFAEYNAGLGATAPSTEETAPAARPKNGSKGGGRAAEKRERVITSRHVHIKLLLTGDDEPDNALMERLKSLLRQYPGEDRLHIYLYWPDGEMSHLEPQSLNVTYTPEFASIVTQLVGGNAETVRLEERGI